MVLGTGGFIDGGVPLWERSAVSEERNDTQADSQQGFAGASADRDAVGVVWSSVVIVGCGLLGTSLGLALRGTGWRGTIVGVARREATLAAAKRMGGIDRGCISVDEAMAAVAEAASGVACGADAGAEPQPGTTDACVREASTAGSGPVLVVMGVPLGHFDAVFEQLAGHGAMLMQRGAVLTDVGSTKASVLASATRHLPTGLAARFVGSHPMAGSERQGPEHATADLFAGKPCVTTPIEANTVDLNAADAPVPTDPAALAGVEAMWWAIGMRVLRLTPAEHDEQVAAISHLPHAAACLLIETVEQLGGWEIASTGLRDTTRLASSNPPMRADIMAANREAIDAALGRFIQNAQRLREAIFASGEDPETLLAYLHARRDRRDRWEHGEAD